MVGETLMEKIKDMMRRCFGVFPLNFYLSKNDIIYLIYKNTIFTCPVNNNNIAISFRVSLPPDIAALIILNLSRIVSIPNIDISEVYDTDNKNNIIIGKECYEHMKIKELKRVEEETILATYMKSTQIGMIC